MVREICACCHVFRHVVMKLHKIGLGNHHGVPAVAEVSSIFHLFCKYVAGVDNAVNVEDLDVVVDDCFADFAFSEVDVFHALVGEG